MIKINKGKNIFLTAFIFFSVIAITNPTISHATSLVGVVNYQILVNQHPDMAQANATYQAAVK